MKLRIDIQIMRGIAVLVVVLYHLGFSGFSNGFLGVDLFFVVSGFLMAVLYKKGEAKKFYSRRVERLLPAYFVTVFLTVFISSFIALPTDHFQVVEQGVFATFFFSNFGFWLQDSYFDSGFFQPLLHLWSLGVEVQFYLIVPLLFWLHWKSKYISLMILLGSLLACLVLTQYSPYTSFFLTPFRIWQFLAGAAVALYLTNNGAVKYSRPEIGLLGMVSLLALIAFYPVDGKALGPIYGHPGLAAVLITLSSGLILCFGLPSSFLKNSIAKALKKLGDWSYSIYLAHFPVIVLYLYEPFSGTILNPDGIAETIVLLVLIAVFSAFLYIFLDKKRWESKLIWLPAFFVVSFSAIFLSSIFAKQGYSEKEINILSYDFDRPLYRCGKVFRILNPKADYCELTKPTELSEKAKMTLLLIGDSHSDSIKESFSKIAEEKGISVFFPVFSPPVLGRTKTERLLEIADEIGADAIVAHYRYTNALAILEQDFVEKTQDKGLKLYWISAIPSYGKTNIPEMLWNMKEKLPDNEEPQEVAFSNKIKKKLTDQNVIFFDPRPAFCKKTEKTERCRIVHDDGKPYYFDSHHLTITGAQQLDPFFKKWMEEIKAAKAL